MPKEEPIDYVAEAIAEIDAWQKLNGGISDGKLSQHATAAQHAVERIRARTGQIRTLEIIVRYIRRNPHGPNVDASEVESARPKRKAHA